MGFPFCRKRPGYFKSPRRHIRTLLVCHYDGHCTDLVRNKGSKTNIHTALTVCSALCVASFIVTALVPLPAVALLGCALCGLSVSLMWPGMLSLTAADTVRGVAMFALLALAGDLGCSIGPQFVGIIADRSRLNTGLLAAIIFPVIMLIGLAF